MGEAAGLRDSAGPRDRRGEKGIPPMKFRVPAASAALMLLVAAAPCAAKPCGDVNDNNKLTSADALAVLRSAVGQPVKLICGPYGEVVRSAQKISFGAGSDGDLQPGVARSYVDNGDGTITDRRTGLVWEKKDRSGGVHDQDRTYTWTDNSGNLDGTAVSEFLAALNAGEGFAGHNDWRIPNIRELVTLVHYGVQASAPNIVVGDGSVAVRLPMVFPIFDSDCAADCSVLDCSCTDGSPYWTSSTRLPDAETGEAWFVDFGHGDTAFGSKPEALRVRAVRGGQQ